LIAEASGLPLSQGAAFTVDFWELTGTETRLLFSSEIDNLRWVPQQAIATWIGTSWLLESILDRRPARHAVLVHAATVLWSPFVAVGLLPFTLAAVARRRSDALAWPSFAGVAIALPVALYFLGHSPHHPVGLLLGRLDTAAAWLKYVLFLLLAVGVLWAAVGAVRRRYGVPDTPLWRTMCLACLVAISATFVHMGHYNDWAMRTPMPAVLVIRLVVAVTAIELWRRHARRLHKVAFAVLVLLSAERTLKAWLLVPLGKFGGTAEETSIVRAGEKLGRVPDLPRGPDWDYPSQYLGSSDSLFARHLMAQPPNGPGPDW
jgi:hypothetical protein